MFLLGVTIVHIVEAGLARRCILDAVVFNPLSLFAPARWAVDLYRKSRQAMRKVTVLVHGPARFETGGASPLTMSPEWISVPTTGTPVTGMGNRPEIGDESVGAGQSLYWFMKVTNKSLTREIELTNVWFAGAKDDELLTWSEPLPARLKPDQTWEGWLNAARLAHASSVEQSGRALISGKARPIRSRKNKHVHQRGHVAGR